MIWSGRDIEMAPSATAIIPRILGFIPMLVMLLCLILVLIYRPPFYLAVVFGIGSSFVFIGVFFIIVLKKARRLKRERELGRG